MIHKQRASAEGTQRAWPVMVCIREHLFDMENIKGVQNETGKEGGRTESVCVCVLGHIRRAENA